MALLRLPFLYTGQMLADSQLLGNELVDKDWVKITCKIGAISLVDLVIYRWTEIRVW